MEKFLNKIKAKNVYNNLEPAVLVEEALKRSEGKLTSTGALLVKTGKYTGRSPKDKFIVDTDGVHNEIAWGKVNRPISREKFDALRGKVAAYLQGREVFIFDLHEPCLAHTMHILHELLTSYQFILNIDGRMKPIFIIQIVQYAKEDNEKLFLIVDDALFVDRIQINHIVILYKSLRMADGSHPVNFIVSPMQVLDGKQYKIPVLLIKRD